MVVVGGGGWLQASVMLSNGSVTCSVVFLKYFERYLEILKHVLTQVGM